MAGRLHDRVSDDTLYNVRDGWDPTELLHPAQAFEHPSRTTPI